jgi:hypothetical protein
MTVGSDSSNNMSRTGPFDGTKAMRAEEMAARSADCKSV